MNPPLEELACLYVLDQLDARARAGCEARLLQDPQFAALVREFEAALARHIAVLPQHEPPASLLGRIEARLDRQPAVETSAPVRSARLPWTAIARWGLAAAIAAGVGTIAIENLRRAPAAVERPFVIIVGLDPGRSTFARLPMQERPQGADARFIQLAALAEQFWRKPEGLPVRPGAAGQSGRGYALFDPGSNQGFIAIQQLPAVEAGQCYHLWIGDTASGRTREAGVLPVNESSGGLYFFSIAPAAGVKPERLDFFVTVEDTAAPNPGQPRGKVVLGDKGI